LTAPRWFVHVAPVSEPSEGLRKHRHDLGHEDHGAKLAAGTTRGIQIMLGLWIALTLGLVIYAVADSTINGGGRAPERGAAVHSSRAEGAPSR
jgi:type IV secretory pathway TrbD component